MGVHDTNDSDERMSTDSTGVVVVVLLQAEACQEKFNSLSWIKVAPGF